MSFKNITIGFIISILLSAVLGLLFSLGWFMRGDLIYSSMFNKDVSIIKQLPVLRK